MNRLSRSVTGVRRWRRIATANADGAARSYEELRTNAAKSLEQMPLHELLSELVEFRSSLWSRQELEDEVHRRDRALEQRIPTQNKTMKFGDITNLLEVSPGRLLGHVDITFGKGQFTSFHCELIRVEADASGEQIASSSHEETQERWMDMCNFDMQGAFETITVDGFEGDWVMFITPFIS